MLLLLLLERRNKRTKKRKKSEKVDKMPTPLPPGLGVTCVTNNQHVTYLYFSKPYIQNKIRLHQYHCVPCDEIFKTISHLDVFVWNIFPNAETICLKLKQLFQQFKNYSALCDGFTVSHTYDS